MLAAANISFIQKTVDSRQMFLKLSERQLPFGQLPLLQIDGYEIVQSQAMIRYIAKRKNLIGDNSEQELKCDMIAETIRGLTYIF
jgi:glutathione S-transferase